MMKNSTAKALKIAALAMYVAGVVVAIAILSTGNTALMFLVPLIVIVAIVLHALPEIQATNHINRIFNP